MFIKYKKTVQYINGVPCNQRFTKITELAFVLHLQRINPKEMSLWEETAIYQIYWVVKGKMHTMRGSVSTVYILWIYLIGMYQMYLRKAGCVSEFKPKRIINIKMFLNFETKFETSICKLYRTTKRIYKFPIFFDTGCVLSGNQIVFIALTMRHQDEINGIHHN
jgi:hypothetical protein